MATEDEREYGLGDLVRAILLGKADQSWTEYDQKQIDREDRRRREALQEEMANLQLEGARRANDPETLRRQKAKEDLAMEFERQRMKSLETEQAIKEIQRENLEYGSSQEMRDRATEKYQIDRELADLQLAKARRANDPDVLMQDEFGRILGLRNALNQSEMTQINLDERKKALRDLEDNRERMTPEDYMIARQAILSGASLGTLSGRGSGGSGSSAAYKTMNTEQDRVLETVVKQIDAHFKPQEMAIDNRLAEYEQVLSDLGRDSLSSATEVFDPESGEVINVSSEDRAKYQGSIRRKMRELRQEKLNISTQRYAAEAQAQRDVRALMEPTPGAGQDVLQNALANSKDPLVRFQYWYDLMSKSDFTDAPLAAQLALKKVQEDPTSAATYAEALKNAYGLIANRQSRAETSDPITRASTQTPAEPGPLAGAVEKGSDALTERFVNRPNERGDVISDILNRAYRGVRPFMPHFRIGEDLLGSERYETPAWLNYGQRDE